jgi:predicted phosphodiesterase
MSTPGRTCPVSYRYGARALRGPPQLETDTLWIAGGLYGNTLALQVLLDAYAAEPGRKALVFNGDFHWFDVDSREFELVNETVLAFLALRGNVETELAAPAEEAGCGCAYPDWVGDATVEHSNRIIERLRATARQHPGFERLARLPMHLVAQVGKARIGIVHGDADSLAGWGFSQEALNAAVERAFDEAQVDVFASSHTCLPVLQNFANGVVVNNGAAGMPNFRGESYGLATRISLRPGQDRVYGMQEKGLFIEAMPLRYDPRAWQKRFLTQWPPGSDAHRSYWDRIAKGPAYAMAQAVRISGMREAPSVACR